MTIISDSIAKYVSGIEGCVVQAFRGDTISKLTRRIQSHQAALKPYDYVILHVGTNDIANRASFREIISDFGNLIAVCKNENPSIEIIISAIIPRPIDHKISDPVIREVNSYLNKKMSKTMNFRFICTYRPFTYCGKIRIELYAKLDGGLHLNNAGTNRLKQFFVQVISHL